MKVGEYLERYNEYMDVTFIKVVARKDDNTPFYHEEYKTTPIRTIREWKHNTELMDSFILNDKQCPIDWLSGALWSNHFYKGRLLSLLVVDKKNIEMLFSPEQAARTIKFIDQFLTKKGDENNEHNNRKEI